MQIKKITRKEMLSKRKHSMQITLKKITRKEMLSKFTNKNAN